jgi:hypothetical protein
MIGTAHYGQPRPTVKRTAWSTIQNAVADGTGDAACASGIYHCVAGTSTLSFRALTSHGNTGVSLAGLESAMPRGVSRGFPKQGACPWFPNVLTRFWLQIGEVSLGPLDGPSETVSCRLIAVDRSIGAGGRCQDAPELPCIRCPSMVRLEKPRKVPGVGQDSSSGFRSTLELLAAFPSSRRPGILPRLPDYLSCRSRQLHGRNIEKA